MMKLRPRRPFSVYNASPHSISDQPARKRQRKCSNPTQSDNEENSSDVDKRFSLLTSDGECRSALRFPKEKVLPSFSESDDDDRGTGIQPRSIAAEAEISDDGTFMSRRSCVSDLFDVIYLASSISIDEETSEYLTDDEGDFIVEQPKTRMVTRQMSLTLNNQLKGKPNVKVQPFVDHSEDTLR